MALRLRRGTDAERQLITPVEGELIYTTDTKLLYVGDGTTVGGTLVTGAGGGGSATLDGLTDTELTGAENGDVLSFNAGTNKWQPAEIPGLSSFGIDELDGVFIDTNTLKVGDVLALDGAGNWKNTALFEEQQSYKINIVGDDSTIIIDGDTNTVRGTFLGELIGDVLGDVKGSVFADDSTILVDGVSGTITGDIITGNIAGLNNRLDIESSSVTVTNAVADANPNDAAKLVFNASKGTLGDPETVALGDSIITIRAGGWNGSDYSSQAGINFLVSANTIGTGSLPGRLEFFVLDDNDTYNTAFLRLESTGVLTAAALQSLGMNAAAKAALITKANASGSDIPVDGTIVYDTDLGTLSTYHSTDGWNNVLTANLPVESSSHFKVGSFATGSLPSSPSAGMIAFDSTTNEFKGYNGTAWVVLG